MQTGRLRRLRLEFVVVSTSRVWAWSPNLSISIEYVATTQGQSFCYCANAYLDILPSRNPKQLPCVVACSVRDLQVGFMLDRLGTCQSSSINPASHRC
jgi:hypothetical protein